VFAKLLDLLNRAPPATADTVGAPFSRRDVAVAALLIEAAQIDRSSDRGEFAAVGRVVRERFGLDSAAAGQLIAKARRELDASLEDWVFAAAVRDGFTVEERAEILELLWEVVCADGQLASFEEALLHRLSRLLRVNEATAEAARARAFARSGRSGSGEPE
jgi:uncharacterized tellurite resistance protein B-like protein